MTPTIQRRPRSSAIKTQTTEITKLKLTKQQEKPKKLADIGSIKYKCIQKNKNKKFIIESYIYKLKIQYIKLIIPIPFTSSSIRGYI